jgi:hypothetical protein
VEAATDRSQLHSAAALIGAIAVANNVGVRDRGQPRASRTVGAAVEQRDMEIFLTLADELHFGRAAQRLHVSTARVSQTIKKVERRIGAPLFERTPGSNAALAPVAVLG